MYIHKPLILKTGVLGEEIFLPFLVRDSEFGIVPELGQLRVDLLSVRAGADERMADLVLK